MKKTLAALAITALIGGTTVSAVSAADAGPLKVTPAQLADRFHCAHVSDGYAVGTIVDQRLVKSAVYAIPGDRTAVVRPGSDATQAAVLASTSGDWPPSLRYVCERYVPLDVVVSWS